MIELFNSYTSILTLLGVVSAVIFVISLLSLPWLAAKIPEDYFLHHSRKRSPWLSDRRPVFRFFIIATKNLLGLILLAGGFLMLFIPGQGILTIVLGLVLMDYPGKYALEKKLFGYPSVFKGLNWLRAKVKQPPLKIDKSN